MFPELVGLLLRFRVPEVVLLADIEKALLMIELDEADREVSKFLWLKDFTKPATNDNIIIYRFQCIHCNHASVFFGIFGLKKCMLVFTPQKKHFQFQLA